MSLKDIPDGERESFERSYALLQIETIQTAFLAGNGEFPASSVFYSDDDTSDQSEQANLSRARLFRTMYVENLGAWPPSGFDNAFLDWIGEPNPSQEPSRALTPAERAALLAKEVIGKRGSQGLLPERHPTKDFFVADIVDYAIKSDMATMEVPTFSLQTKPDMETFVWQSSDGKRGVRIVPSEIGRATQFDKDLLIYVTSQLVATINRGGPVTERSW